MATFVANGITFDTNSGTKTVTLTPAQGELIVIVVANTGNVATPTVTDNNTDGKGTYTEITASASLKATSADRMSIFVRNALIGAAASTIFSMAPGVTTGGGLSVFRVKGMWKVGAAAIRQSAIISNGAAAGTPAPVFGTAGLTGNMKIGAVFNATSPATLTPRTSYTERNDVGFATPTTGLETITRDTGETGTTQTWGSTSASAFCASIVELDSAADYPIYATVANGDNFNRANENPLAGNWMNFSGSGLAGGMALTTNAVNTSSASFCGSLWKRDEYYMTEFFLTVATQDINVGKMLKFNLQHHTPGVFPPLDGPSPSQDGYQITIDEINASEWIIYRIDNGTGTALLTVPSFAVVSGDGVGARYQDGIISAWRRQSGVWGFVGAVSDATYKQGWIGLVSATNTVTWDDAGIGGLVIPQHKPQAVSQSIRRSSVY